MRAALALATVLTATSLVGLGSTAPAGASGCHARFPGWTISDVELRHGLGCEHAQTVIHHAMLRTTHSIDWRCNVPAGRSWKQFSCWSNHSSHSVAFLAHENGSTGGF